MNGKLIRAGVLLCGLGLAGGALGQQTQLPPPTGEQGPPPGPGGRGPEQRMEMMQKELNLTPEQMAKVRSIFEANRPKMMAIRNDSTLSQEDRRDKMMKLQHDQTDQIKAVLDDAQKTKFDAMQARMRERMRDRQPGGPPAPGSEPPMPPAPGRDTPPPTPGSNTPPPPPPPGAETQPPQA